MSRRKKKKKGATKAKPEEFGMQAFGDLKALKISEAPKKEAKKNKESLQDNYKNMSEVDESELFLSAFQDATLFKSNQSSKKSVYPELEKVDEDAEAQLEFFKITNGELPFDVSDSSEYIEGNIRDLPEQVIKRLRKGEYPIQDQLDLHGKTKSEARDLIELFIRDCCGKGFRSVLIVHGRGIHSKDQIPVLKDSIRAWFERGRGRIGESVLAYSSARRVDGGLGAMYVLLRRRKVNKS